ncbi:putative UDP-glycosyltransferase 708A6 [Iris pallida]|uniref:UDP-glycosyltransferase 708A6 n=1 Tax=Iris pallida TaxID=29817 RepID=A0AAX6GB46_IRIPA|nr:putative UDP-glycosyltransferase 708A6 [Iris pallida]
MNSSSPFLELPPTPIALAASSPSLFAESLSSSSSIISLTFFPISSPLTTTSPQPHSSIQIPSPLLLTTSAFTLWSPPLAHPSILTPADAASNTEFEPQWLRNPPTARWLSTSSCSTHPFTTSPLPFKPSI